MDLKSIQKTLAHVSLSEDTPLVYYSRIETLERSLLLNSLPQSELNLAKKYSASVNAHTFLASRFVLRNVLSPFLNTHPGSIEFAYTTKGKPYLPDTDINFNISHSENVLALALIRGVKIGVDLECMDRDVDVNKMIPTLFSSEEQVLIENTGPVHRKQVFIDFWTKKEALLKGCGSGLSQTMNRLNLATNHSLNSERCFVRMNDTDWKVESRTVFENYRLSVAYQCNRTRTENNLHVTNLNLLECTL